MNVVSINSFDKGFSRLRDKEKVNKSIDEIFYYNAGIRIPYNKKFDEMKKKYKIKRVDSYRMYIEVLDEKRCMLAFLKYGVEVLKTW